MSAPTGASASSSDGGIPAIRTFQFDSTSIGQLSSAVNLFRGDVNIPQSLFTLPGRHGSGLDVEFSILYQSNVARQAMLWNREAPTGVLGLGWSLPLTYIEAATTGSPDPQTRIYVLYDNGVPSPLIRQPRPAILFQLPSHLADSLQAGQVVTADVRDQFLQLGLPLDPGAKVGGQAGSWTITDDALQQDLLIRHSSDPTVSTVHYGGQAFQLQAYRFWHIVYFPSYERWLIVTDDGIRKSFGGIARETTRGSQAPQQVKAVGNSIAWQVWWGASGIPTWTGSSTVKDGQMQVARGWYLASTSDRFGDTIRYAYQVAEQQVGGGLTYTKAVYLEQVTDVYGRTAALSYEEKLCDHSADGSPREYADPHREVPGSDPGPYQDLYETKYLSGVTLKAPGGALLFTVEFEYNPRPAAQGPDRAVANVTSFTGRLLGDTFKRYLTRVTIRNAAGDSLPGYCYEYHLDPSKPGAQPGALKTLICPKGGKATYSYTLQLLQVCTREQEVDRPSQTPSGTPRVFYGDNYVVSVWFDAVSSKITLQVWSWYGRWICWQLDPNNPLLDDGQFDGSSINVLASSQFFILTFDRTDTSVAYVFNKQIAKPGTFAPAVLEGQTTGVNTPTLTLSRSSGSVSYVVGDSFFAAAQMNTNARTNPWMYKVLTYRWFTRAWDQRTLNPQNLTYLAARGEYLLAVDSAGKVALSYLDGALDWRYPAPLPNVPPPGADPTVVALAAGPGFAALNVQQSPGNYQLTIIQWDASHSHRPGLNQSLTESQYAPGDNTAFGPPAIVGNSMVAVNGFLFRFTGGGWVSNQNLVVQAPQQDNIQRYAYGTDYALQVVTNSSGYNSTAAALGFDPNANSTAWNTTPAAPALPYAQNPYDDFPAAGDDYACLGPMVFFRGTATDWTSVFSSPQQSLANLGTLSQGFDSQSLVNEGPGFLSYSVLPPNSRDNPTVQAIVLQNGQVKGNKAIPFDGERMYTASLEELPPVPARSPHGPGVFVTYPTIAASFDSATKIFLHRYAGDGVSGPLAHYPISRFDIDDQYQDVATTLYDPDPNHAACDPTGLVIKYYQNTVYPGTTDKNTRPYGSTTNRYLNGLNVTTGDNDHNMLDGLLLETVIQDSGGNTLESQRNQWVVVEQVASDPTDPGAPAIPLSGGWIARTQQTSVTDGVTRAKVWTYCPAGLPGPYTGRPVSIETQSCDGTGVSETRKQWFRYGVEVNPALRALNMRSTQVQKTSTTQQGGSAGAITLKSSASSFAPWPSGVGPGVLVPAHEASFRFLDASSPHFPYDTYTAGSTPEGWLLDGRVTKRTTGGQVHERVDPCGTASTVLFSKDLTYPVAQVSNAAAGAAAYLGFEPYEDTSAWTLQNTQMATDDVRTGTTSLRLPGGAAARISVGVTPGPAARTYVVGYWYKTAPGFSPGADAGCIVENAGSPIKQPFASTDGAWKLQTIGVPLTARTGPLEVKIANGGGQDVLVDSVYVAPLLGSLIARTYDPLTRDTTSTMDLGGRTRWMYFDAFRRSTIQIGPNGQPKELAQRFLSRQGSAQDTFLVDTPNTELTLHPADGGSLETFRNGDAWQRTWSPSDAAHWRAGGGAILHLGGSVDSLTYQGSLPSPWAVYFEVARGTMPPVLTLHAGEVSVSWSGSAYTGSALGSALGAPPSMALHWLLVAGDGLVLFFADGQLIFSRAGRFNLAAPVLSTGADLSIRHLAILASPRVGVSYNDGAGRQRQVQQLHGSDSRVSEVIFDPLDRKVAVTRVAPGSFGSGASRPVLQYRPGFVDVRAFLDSLATTGAMTGDIADYYAGQVDGGITRSNDEGYPFRGTRWEASPRHRKVELGLPGKPYAIADPSQPPANRATTQFTYSANNGTAPALPAGQYSQTTVTTPLKKLSSHLKDKLGQDVGVMQQDSTGTTTAQSSASRSFDQATGPRATLSLRLPNALLSGPHSDDARFVRATVADAAGRAETASDPNAGQTRFLYDPSGRIRFVQPAMDTGENWYLYNKYDAIGRLIEQGTIPQAWDPVTLAVHAAEIDWPGSQVSRTVALAWSYDGDGKQAAEIGRKTGCVTTTPAPTGTPCVATETFRYDDSGHLTGVTLKLSGPASAQGVTSYTYNNLGELTKLTMPAGSPLAQVVYTINDQGWITSIGSSPSSPADIAAYTYTIEGALQTESLGGGKWERTVQYTSPGWVHQVVSTSADGKQSLSMSYDYNADGTIAARHVSYEFASLSGVLDDKYTYDGQGRLSAAEGSSDEQIDVYDPNGNIWDLTQGGTKQSFRNSAGTDKIETIGPSSPVSYDARGRMTGSLGRTLGYDNTTNLTAEASTAVSQIQFGYGGHGQRVLKLVRGQAAAQSVYFTGASSRPIARIDGNQWWAMVHGPTGLVAVYADQVYFPLKDNQRSVWAVVNAGGIVARYVYLPFGGTTADGANPDVLRYRYMGQEWDPELSLYNFGARMYDPMLRRFLAPDAARQFPSPYLFCGNNPLVATDPTGDLSLWAQITIGLGMFAVLVGGIALSFVTLGAAAPEVAAAEGALGAAEAGAAAGTAAGEAGGAAAAEGGAAAAEGGAAGGAGAAEGGAAGAGEVSSGAAEGGSAWTSFTSGLPTPANFGIQVAAGTVQGVGTSGIQYDIENGRDFTAAGFFESLGWGALSGALGGALGAIPGLGEAAESLGFGAIAKFGINLAENGVEGAGVAAFTQELTNLAHHDPWYQGLLEATLVGFGESAVLGGLTEGLNSHAELKTDLQAKIGEESVQGVSTMVDRVLASARSQEGLMMYGTASFFIVAGYSLWGAVDWSANRK